MRLGKQTTTEKLEPRVLLSVSLNTTTGLLSVTGTPVGDQIVVSRSGSNVKVFEAGSGHLFAATVVKSLKVTLGAGSDSVLVDSAVMVPASLIAGSGPDTLTAGGGSTTFFFGAAAAGGVGAVQYVIAPGPGGSALDFTAIPAADAVTVDLTSDVHLATFDGKTIQTMTVGQAALITTVTGGAGDDNFTANSAADSLAGGTGNSTLAAGSGADTLSGSGPQTDYVFRAQSVPTVYTLNQAKAGVNQLDFSALSAADAVTANLNCDLLASYDSVQVKDAKPGEFKNFNWIDGGQGDDILTANNLGDTINGGDGSQDYIYGGSGADFIQLGSGTNIVSGEGGPDIILGGSGYDIVYATDYTSDPLWYPASTAPSTNVAGLQFFAGSGDASVVGGPGNDALVGGSGNCTLHGMGGNDYMIGGSENSVLFGDNGNDTVIGGQGDNIISGGNGQNVVYGGTVGGTHTFIAKNLPDDYATAAQGVALDTNALAAAAIAAAQGLALPTYPEASGPGDTVIGGSATTTILGGGGDETLRGGDGQSTVVGGSGNDLLIAGYGADVVQGGAGDDTLAAGGGPDVLTGGAGNATFLNLNGYADTITGGGGFNVAQEDPTGLSIFSNIQVIYTPFYNNTGPVSVGMSSNQVAPLIHRPAALTLAAVISGVLHVGSATYTGNQSITISQDPSGLLTVSQANVGVQTFAAAGIKSVIVAGGPGSDNVDIDSLTLPASVNGGNGNNFIVGGPGRDTLSAGTGSDTIIGSIGFTTISGGAGNNVLYGGTGNDVINGGPGSDWIYPGGFGISLPSDHESDTINGGTGTEKVDMAGNSDAMNIRLDKGTITDLVTGVVTKIGRVRNIYAGAGSDLIVGATAGGVLLNAGSGNDTIFGISGSDVIYGGVGNDLTFLDGNQGFIDLAGNHATTPGNVDQYNQGSTILPPLIDPSDLKTTLQHPLRKT